MLELDGVCKGYRDDPREVLADVDLTVAPGELVAVVGRSGAGKSTLLQMVAGLVRPSRGTIRMRGAPVRGAGPERALVFQSYALLPWLTAYENVLLAARCPTRTEEMLALVGLESAHGKRPPQLSGGMRQRVALARALSMQPEVLLLDEPLSALDALTRAQMQEEIVSIWSRHRTTALLVTNDVDEAILLADRIVPLGRGPGASLGEPIAVDLPRPRSLPALRRDPAFHALRARVSAELRGETSGAFEVAA